MGNEKTGSTVAMVRFIVGSLLGIFIFFVNIPIQGKSMLPIDWISNLAKALLANFNLPLALLSSIVVIHNIVKRKLWKSSPFEVFLYAISVIGIVLFLLDLFHILPSFIIEDGTYQKALATMVPFSVGIAVIMFLLPPLINYGLPEAIAVFARPLTRVLFNLPGVSAVTIVSAFMGNFTAGHLQTDAMYKQGKITHKEAAIMATGFCTSSVGLIMSVCAAGGQMDKFTILFFLIFASTLVITGITSHIYPLCKYPNEYYEGVTPEIEEASKGNMFVNAYHAGIKTCEGSLSIPKQCVIFGIRTMPTVANILVSGTACMFVFTVINKYTPLFTWIGMLFWPLLKLVGFQDVNLVAGAVGINAVDNVTSQLTLATAAGADAMTVIFGCGFGIMTIIFFGTFLASLYSTKIKVKFQDLLLLWVERTALTILIWGFIARMLA